jgi:CubicO group peptidase (beta-lactamase class C family)
MGALFRVSAAALTLGVALFFIDDVRAVPDIVSAVPVARTRAHKFVPANIASARSVEYTGPYRPAGVAVSTKPMRLDTDKFTDDLHGAFMPNAKGYALVLMKDGTVVESRSDGRARQGKDFSVDTRQHVASVSKLVAAMATVKALTDRGLTFDEKIGPYLPVYWTVGTNVANITFRRLLTHTSGFVVPPMQGESSNPNDYAAADYPTMKAVVAAGVPSGTPSPKYLNINFSILRVLLSTLTGAVAANISATSDAAWDIQTTEIYLSYLQAKVFGPAGIADVSGIPDDNGAYAYYASSDQTPWNSGDLTTVMGGAGLRLSAKEVATLLDAYQRGKIVPAARANEAIEAGLGLDWELSTAAGKLWMKNGLWNWADGNDWNCEQAVAFILPGGYRLGVVVNSYLGSNADLAGTVRNAYVANIAELSVSVAPPTKRKTTRAN